MAIHDLQSYVQKLDENGALKRVTTEVDPKLEITEIAQRSVRENGPALLFENVKGSSFPVAINLMASMERIELGLRAHPEQIGEELYNVAEDILPPTAAALWKQRGSLLNLTKILPRKVSNARVKEFRYPAAKLSELPILTCWPGDAGAFLTLPLVITRDLVRRRFNMGMYRMQMLDDTSTGMHCQLQKGGSFHLQQAKKASGKLDFAVALGGDPALILAATMALPEGIDEMGFAGFLRGGRTRLTKSASSPLRFPADAEFILEGTVDPTDTVLEGPFGDHFGHYSTQEQFPVFRIHTMYRRQNAIYPATVVGKPPMEDKYIGNATQLIIGPLLKVVQPEVNDFWTFFEAGFHNLAVASVKQRYSREALKTAFGILGQGQLSLTKTLILVDQDVNPRSLGEVAAAIKRNFTTEQRLMILAGTAIDTLDFTGDALHSGSKMVIDATASDAVKPDTSKVKLTRAELAKHAPDVTDMRVIRDAILVVKTASGKERESVERLVAAAANLRGVKIVAAVSDDVNLADDTEVVWGIFTRFDAALDTVCTSHEVRGMRLVNQGILGIDASWKSHYPQPITMEDSIIKKVRDKWSQY